MYIHNGNWKLKEKSKHAIIQHKGNKDNHFNLYWGNTGTHTGCYIKVTVGEYYTGKCVWRYHSLWKILTD